MYYFITLQIDSREPVEFLSTTVSQAAIVLQQPSKHSTGHEFSHLTVVIRRVSVNHCFAGSNCLTTASDHRRDKNLLFQKITKMIP